MSGLGVMVRLRELEEGARPWVVMGVRETRTETVWLWCVAKGQLGLFRMWARLWVRAVRVEGRGRCREGWLVAVTVHPEQRKGRVGP